MINKIKTFFKECLIIVGYASIIITCFLACSTKNKEQPIEERTYELDLINGKTYTVTIKCHRDAKEICYLPSRKATANVFEVRALKYNYFGIPNGRNWWDYTCNGVVMYRRVQ